MDSVLHGLVIYFFLLLITRLSGKRTLAEVTTFDFILLLIISETTTQGLVGEDFSVINSAILITTLIGSSILLSLIQRQFPKTKPWLDSTPLIILENGQPLKDRMHKERVDESEILEAARRLRGLERLDQIKFAVLEKDGGITIIPKRDQRDVGSGA